MSEPFLDRLPSREREKIRRKLRSPEAYERLRERVKGPEDLQNEMDKAEKLAELSFALETEPQVRDKIKAELEKDLQEKGIEAILETQKIPEDVQQLLLAGKFTVSVSEHASSHEDTLMILPEGNIHDRLPVKTIISNAYAGVMVRKKH